MSSKIKNNSDEEKLSAEEIKEQNKYILDLQRELKQSFYSDKIALQTINNLSKHAKHNENIPSIKDRIHNKKYGQQSSNSSSSGSTVQLSTRTEARNRRQQCSLEGLESPSPKRKRNY